MRNSVAPKNNNSKKHCTWIVVEYLVRMSH